MQADILTAIRDVLRLRDLAPSARVNNAMTALVYSIIHDSKTTVSSLDPVVKLNVRQISSDAESEMEKYWARRVIHSSDSESELREFPYLDNYMELTRRELELVEASGLSLNGSHAVLVIGSGPLPLSAFEMNRQSGVRVDHVDSSREAIALCRDISTALGVESAYYHALGHEVVPNKKYDLVLVAALAGASTDDKQRIIDNILPFLKHDGRIVVRSAKDNRELLYPAIEATALSGVRLLKEYHPTDYIINSVFVYERSV